MLLAIMVILFWIAVLKLAARVLGRRIPWRLALVLVLLCWLWISYVGKVF